MAIDFEQIEKKWLAVWEKNKAFEANAKKGKKKFFLTFPYPYMNGFLHIGHLYTLMRVEAFARYKRMQGFNVLFPQGWHCTGSPIENAAQRIREREPKQLEIMKQMGLNEKEILEFGKPEHWADFFPKEAEKDYRSFGLSVDFRRQFITTSLNPQYDKFIQWQFSKLKEKGLVVMGKHPVVWCVKDNSPVGDHARVEGEGETPQEFVLLKFKFNDAFIVAATLRPETIFGQTNLWVNPELEYSIALVDSEKWIASKECFEKLSQQEKKIEFIGSINGKELLGKRASAPGIERQIIILPATFCDPTKGTGIVTSVPSDAPDDWIGLRDLQQSREECERFGLDWEEIKAIKPIPIIDSAELGNMAAIKVCEQLGIKNQKEREKLEQAKHIVYKQGFYTGKMTAEADKYAGMPVENAKELVKKELVEQGKADKIFELTGKVVCRCLTPSIVKIVSNQWFIKYGDKAWKQQAHKAMQLLKLYPDTSRPQFEYVIDWLNDWACTREFGLGTKLPWDEKWVIESLSDSTIYMAYYTIAHLIKKIPMGQLDNNLFDCIFLGKGDKKKIKIKPALLKQMQEEFNYWYPVDFRNSGKDLIQNHLTFFIFNHTAIFPEKFWPRGIGTNGWVTVEGEKMSKSKGNFYTMRDIRKKFSVDPARITLMLGGEGLDDANWDSELARTTKQRLLKNEEFYLTNYGKGTIEKKTIDSWMESELHRIIKEATLAMEETKFRTAINCALFDLQNAFKWYLRRTAEKPNKQILKQIIETQLLILAPFAPFYCEEIWQKIGKKGLISLAQWPEYNEKKISIQSGITENAIRKALEDIAAVQKITGKTKPAKIVLYTAQEWKWRVLEILAKLPGERIDFSTAIKAAMLDKELKEKAKELPQFLNTIIKRSQEFRQVKKFDEFSAFSQAKPFFEKEFCCEILIEKAETTKFDPAGKAKNALPLKPAIYLE